ncbi:MAG: SRPBCC family protein [Anaerolinea sp.]|nr:SRPBCC family protein [Anaerolinea sp.]
METQETREFSGAVRAEPKSRTPFMGYPGVNGRSFEHSVDATAEGMAKFLGWFSIALGLAQVLAPRQMLAIIGLRGTPQRRLIMRVVGVREIASGIGSLVWFRPSAWIRARLAGDVLDLLLLVRALQAPDAKQGQTTAALTAVLGVTVLDVMSNERLKISNPTRSIAQDDRAIHVQKSITVSRPLDEVYRFWRDFENLPRFMGHLESVQVRADGRSHWKAKAPVGMSAEWDAELIADRPNELIAWRSIDGSQITNSGSVHFTPAPGNRGTEVRVDLHYEAPGGALGSLIAKLLGEEPAVQIGDDLRAFKQVMEIGEIVRSGTAEQSRRDGAQPAMPRGGQ